MLCFNTSCFHKIESSQFSLGLFVLATEASVPWVDSVLCDIGDQQSISESLSTFSGHLERIKRIRKEATRRSLVLLDEVSHSKSTKREFHSWSVLTLFPYPCKVGFRNICHWRGSLRNGSFTGHGWKWSVGSETSSSYLSHHASWGN